MKALRSAQWPIVTLLLCSWGLHAHATDVKGHVRLRSYTPPADADHREYNWQTENGFKETQDPVVAPESLAVVLIGSAHGEAGQVDLRFYGGSLTPSTIAVRPGTAVRIRNDDEIAHELYAVGLEGFSAETTAPRRMRSVALRETGDWELRDRIVPHLKGHLHVIKDLAARAEVDAGGDFVFTGVTPGDYELRVLHGPLTVAKKKVTVGDKALTVDALSLTAPAAKK